MLKPLLNAIAIIPLLIAITMSTSFAKDQGEVVRLSIPIEQTAHSETFGAPFPQSGNPLSLTQLVNQSEEYLDKEVLLNTAVAKVCQKKGCFFIAQDGNTTMRVSFKDYGFFLPTDSGGKTVEMAGKLTRKHISQKQAQHFEKDIGAENGTIQVGKTYEFVASSVRIPTNRVSTTKFQ